MPNHSSDAHSWRSKSGCHLTLPCKGSSISYMDPSVFPLEREETRIWKFHSFFQTRHLSRFFWKCTFTFAQANKASSRKQKSLLPADAATGLFSTASALSAGGTVIDVSCVSSTDSCRGSSEEFPLSADQRKSFSSACLRI